ncbi:MAG: hypothetical protein NTV82_09490 [Candidatus Aminicenantes bacterium]|nr:hypothetical protein [Candidatus Aminicenantes bacterium]
MIKSGENIRQHFDGHLSVEAEVFGPIDLPHFTSAELGQDSIFWGNKSSIGQILADPTGRPFKLLGSFTPSGRERRGTITAKLRILGIIKMTLEAPSGHFCSLLSGVTKD